jgi:hypothetical protein
VKTHQASGGFNWGRPLGDGLLHSEHDGFVIGRAHGIHFFPGDAVLYTAIGDDAPRVAPYPKDYFEENRQSTT